MFTPEERSERINRIRQFPAELEARVKDLSEIELTTRFVAGEWTVAQNVHHLVDSHMNAYIRTRLFLTEDNPTIKPYDQDLWAELPDACTLPIQPSINILHGLHYRWVKLLESLSESDWNRGGIHPEIGAITLEDILRIYSDHGIGHIDQINRTLAAAK